ncbi:pyruvate dehydrogenase (acetyl-transferring) E1 component subunit alpha [Sandaracinus amylolyticus]|uniref:Pyruvate dehydrogenase E1 component subunit alpha n=1 Tax=Sandaracinus amylolyticus TaxID=927083 RepID=A0A0F6W1C0_9BACT|nr:pyruvate dehydrogenase (acetyl-transferring) E1 component subunit alpha [Sandaracinus amylolyticus]AKF04765.1 Pyruvate dehydrogenase E1 component alpha subunit [Sandaracinus amylolyticus]
MGSLATQPAEAPAPRDELARMFHSMQLIRRLEEEAARAYVQGKIGGFLHLYIGQEAIAVGVEAAIRKTDWIITTYRDHGFALTRGTSARGVMAELFGKDTGCARGLGGSMHMFDGPNRFLGGHGIVGGHCSLAAGVGFRCKYLKNDEVVLCFFGEGATNIGGFHEGLSLAGLWKLPVVFVCENNMYSMGTPLERTLPAKDITDKAPGYGMARDRFEGQDVIEVRDRIAKAVARARDGEGPTLVEILTYRFRGHSMSDPGKYRTSEEVEERKRKGDPVRIARQRLLEAGASEDDVARIEAQVEEEVADAVKFADESEPAKESSMLDYVLAKTTSGDAPREGGGA